MSLVRPQYSWSVPLVAAGLLSSISWTAFGSDDPSSKAPELSGYGDFVLTYADYGSDPKASAKGSKRDQRLTFDLRRFVLEWEGHLPRGFEFEAEVEFEHGGTGSALELEYEEAGEYEAEVEKAGEVQLEKLVIKKSWEHSHLAFGQIPVAVGILADDHEPLDFLGAIRPESEEHLLPSSWSEGGVEWGYRSGSQALRLQLITGLDSSGFSSQYFIAEGRQTRFETIKTTNPAAVLRWAISSKENLETGFSLYYGDSSQNRPQPDLVKRCETGDGSSVNSVAPCGYVKTPLVLGSWHAKGTLGSWIHRSSVILGELSKAEEINARNSALSQKYVGVLRSPVAKKAFAAWTEWGYQLPGWEAGDTLTPFLRLEAYDTVWRAASGQFDQARFDRRVVSLGASYLIEKNLYFKLDTAQRRFGSKDLRAESETRFNFGFLF